MHRIEAPDYVTPTPRRVSEPYLRAEIAAFPLTSGESFRRVLLEIDPRLGKDSPTRPLWRTCENMLAQHTGWSLDRLVAARDLGWFGSGGGSAPVPMSSYLRTLARSHLIPRPGITEIEQGTALSILDAADHYRWLTFTMPEDLLLGALGVEPPPREVDIDPPLLVRRLLDLGVAEIHQHMGAGMDFPLLWASTLAAIANPYVKEDALTGPGAPLDDGRCLVRWLLAAAIARCTLAEYLIRGGRRDFAGFLLGEYRTGGGHARERDKRHRGDETDHGHAWEQNWIYRYDSRVDGLVTAWTPGRRDTLLATLRALSTGKDEHLPEFGALRDLYAEIHPTALTLQDDPVNSVEDAYRRCDPIAVRLHLHGINAGERWFLRRGLAFLRATQQPESKVRDPDRDFERLFWQTIRVRCQYYHAIVERPLTGGLQWFLRFYGRLGGMRYPIDSIRPEASYSVAGAGKRIKALELRTHPADTPIAIGTELLDLLRSWLRVLETTPSGGLEPEFGMVYHFVKDRDPEHAWSKGNPAAFWADTYAEPHKQTTDVEHGRYGAYFENQLRKAQALAELITDLPSMLWAIRGLDIASDEMGVPTWVLAPLFRYLVNTSAKVSILPGAGPPLKVTAHVGEDFRHLGEGLRRIYEQIHYVLDADSGRLGHAVALGVEPRSWAESVGSVLMPREERLWDLVWEWRLYTKFRIRPEFAAAAPAGRIDCLLNQVCELQGRVFGARNYRIEELAEVHHLLHRLLLPPFVATPKVWGGSDTFLQAARGIRDGRAPGQVSSARRIGGLLLRYLDDASVFRRGQVLVDVPIRGDEVEALVAVQDALRRGISQRGIVVEVNPSSNLLIGDMVDLRNHPILRLFPPLPDEDGPPPVAIAIGSDDPVTFGTQLMREYTLLYQAACAVGYAERDVQKWLETIRRTGMDARFTRVWEPKAEDQAKQLIQDLRTYLHEADVTTMRA